MQAKHLLRFKLDGHSFAFSLEAVKRIAMVTEYSVANGDADVLMGHISFEGETIPLVNLRRLLSLEERPIVLEDQLIILNADGTLLAVTADTVYGTEAISASLAAHSEKPHLLRASIHNDEVILVLEPNAIARAAKPVVTAEH